VDYLNLTFEEGFKLNVDRLADQIRPNTRLVSLTNPHNPTGAVIGEAELREVIDLVEDKGCYLLLDETYRDMTFGTPPPLAASLSPRTISVSSLSKTYGLPGLRLGWLVCQDKGLMETFLAAKEQIHISNSVVDEEIAYRYLQDKDKHLCRLKAHIDLNLSLVKEWMASQRHLEWVEPAGGVVCFPRIKADVPIDVDRFYDVLNTTYSTYVGPGHWFEMDRRYMRVGYGWPAKDELELGLQNITRAVREAIRR
jgi:aspartate/methionine/tyrosine aminotransferase